LEYESRTEKWWWTHKNVLFLVFLGRQQWSAGLSCFLEATGFQSKCLFQIAYKHRQCSHSKLFLPDLMHRSYSIDIRLAPAFTYTPVYKDPKYSFKLQFFLGVLLMHGAIPKLKRTKKVMISKTCKQIHPATSQTLSFVKSLRG